MSTITKAIFLDFVQQRIAARTESAESLRIKMQDEHISEDERNELQRAYTKQTHAIRFLHRLDSDAVASTVSRAKVALEDVRAVENDAKALDKFASVFVAIRNATYVTHDKAMRKAVAYLAKNDFSDVSYDELQKVLNHATQRQSAMICNFFTRIQCATTNDKVTTFNTEHVVIKRLIEIYSSLDAEQLAELEA